VSFTCPRCLRTSHNPNDELEGYCGACHEVTRIHTAGRALAIETTRAGHAAGEGTYIVTVDKAGRTSVLVPFSVVLVELNPDIAFNVRGLLEAIRQGSIR